MKPLKSSFISHKHEVFSSTLLSSTPIDASKGYCHLDSKSFCSAKPLNKNPSQTSILDSASQAGSVHQKQIPQGSLQPSNRNQNLLKKSIIPGKENIGEAKPSTDTQFKAPNRGSGTVYGSVLLSSFASNHQRRGSLEATDVSSAKSKDKDKKIQDLIESNAPKMTKDKEYYVMKLIQCQDALRTKDKKLKTLEKSEAELKKTLDQISVSEMMYKTELQALRKTQIGKSSQVGDLEFKVSQLEGSIAHKELVWKTTKSNLEVEISHLREKLETQQSNKRSIESKLKSENDKVSALLKLESLYAEAKALNAKLQAKNAQLSGSLSSIQKESSSKTAEFQAANQSSSTKCLELEAKLANLQQQNQQLTLEYEQFRINKEKELEICVLSRKRLEMEVETLTSSLNFKLEEGESSVAKLKASHDHLKFENSQLKKFVQTNQSEQVELQGILKLRNLELQNELKQLRDTTLSEKEVSMKILSELKAQLNQYRNKSVEWQSVTQKSAEEWEASKQCYQLTVNRLEESLSISQQRIASLSGIEEKFNTLTQFTQLQSKEIQNMLNTNLEQKERLADLTTQNEELLDRISQMKSVLKTFNTFSQQIQSFEEQVKSGASLDYSQVFSTINSILGKEYTIWTPLLKPQEVAVKSPYEDSCKAILQTFCIEQVQGWEANVAQTTNKLVSVEKEFNELSAKFKEKMKYYETRLHVCKEEDERKTLVISDLKSVIKLTQRSLNETSDKLLKCTTLLQEANKKIIVGEARLCDAKNQLNTMYVEMKAQNQRNAQQTQNVELQLRDLLSKHYEGFYDQLVERSPEDLLRLDVFLFKAFLSTAIEVNHHIKQFQPTTPYMEQLLIERDGVLGEIRQYYKQLLEPEIAQYLVHYKPVNQQRSNRFQKN